MSKKKEVIFNLLLIFISIFFSLICLEFLYRIKLEHQVTIKPSYVALEKSIYTFNKNLGYSYIPNSNVFTLQIINGIPFKSWYSRVNSQGNIGKEAVITTGNSNERKIFIFGDSFTANPNYGGITWVDYFPANNDKVLEQKYSVENYGRDGYGIIQMIHFARNEIEHLKPSIIILAFITDDIRRGRMWRTTRVIDGKQRVFTSIKPESEPDMIHSIDMTMINSKISEGWYNDLLVQKNKEKNGLLKELNKQYYKILSQKVEILGSLSTSFLLSKLIYKNAFHYSVSKITDRNPRISPLITDFNQDTNFVYDFNKLLDSNIPILLVHLPASDELSLRKYVLNSQEEKLLENLRQQINKHSQVRMANLLEYINTSVPQEELFMLPYDGHPSQTGSKMYAEAITSAFLDFDKAITHSKNIK